MKYILDLLADTRKLAVKPCSTHMFPNVHLMKDDEHPLKYQKRYRMSVEMINYLTRTRLDIAFSLCYVSQFVSSPTIKHWEALEHILCYLKGAP